MARSIQMLSQITDGQAAWDQFLSGARGAFQANAEMVPVLGGVILLALVIWLDLRLARFLVFRSGKSSKRKHTPRPKH